ncbi:hypothetical protein DBR42_15665 [Pelomonas sp. HMWF004]|nr:hypothetical protein DBR42_15665 [Pelomonas sp. HMWF004]
MDPRPAATADTNTAVGDGDDDYVTVEHASSPTEAHVLQGLLVSAGLDAVAQDAHLLQAYDLLTPAAGGVRVMVRHSQLEAARSTLADYRAGNLALHEDDEPAAAALEIPPGPLYSSDIAAILSFVLVNPAFGAGVHLLNARVLTPGRADTLAWLWFAILALGSMAIYVLLALGTRAPVKPALATLAMSMLTATWYLSFAQAHGREMLRRFGPAYRRRSLLPLALGVLALQFMFAAGLQALLD